MYVNPANKRQYQNVANQRFTPQYKNTMYQGEPSEPHENSTNWRPPQSYNRGPPQFRPNPVNQRPPAPYKSPSNQPRSQPYPNPNQTGHRPFQSHPTVAEPSKSTVYVSNLPYELKSEDIHKAFETFGPIVKVTILTVKETRKSKGVAFVLFYNPEDARKCVEEANNSTIFGQTLKVSIARDNGRAPQPFKRMSPEEEQPVRSILKRTD